MAQLNLQKKIKLAIKYPSTAKNTVFDKYLYENKATPFPRTINCFITERCNFNCPMCHVVTSRLKNMNELSLPDLKKFFDNIAPYSPSVSLAGGEPLMHPEIIDIIKYLDQKRIVKGLVTNGMLLEKMAADLINSGLDFLAISLDGPDEATQYQRGLVKDSFPQIIKGIKKIIELRGKNTFPNIRIATVISKSNIANFDKIYEVIKDLGVDEWSISHHFYFYDKIRKQQLKFSQKTKFGNDVWGEYNGTKKVLFNAKERLTISQKLKETQALINSNKSKVKITMPNSMDIKNFYTGAIPKKESICTSPFNQVFLRGNGDIEMCHGYILGNIKENSLLDIWHNKKTIRFQKYIQKNKIIPACFRCCSLNPIF
ncbi:MAG: radical SAM protein [Candidatus Shapirobacteria bacterium]|nr:radical SAM protein [Candidatus Shapirobacteria bacterium]MDD4410535.1 radical SAM protein [Candidatus Shapirobacteria bacterium]